jgi:LysM repeat protein
MAIVYTIKAGDKLQNVAAVYNTTVGAICNVPINSDIVALIKLTPGNLITVPTATGNKVRTIARGDTINTIAVAFNTTVGSILDCKNPQGQLNNDDIIATISLMPGHFITMPNGVSAPVTPRPSPSGPTPVSSGAPVKINQVLTQGRINIYESSTTPSHPLPNNYLTKYPTKDSQPGPEPRIFETKGECAWYTAVVCYYSLNNYAPTRWGGSAGTRPSTSGTVAIYKGDGGNWPNMVRSTPGCGTVTDVPEVNCLISFERSDANPWGHIGVVEDVRAGKDSAGNDIIMVSISEYNRHEDHLGGYRDIAFPARNGMLVNPGDIHFIKMSIGFRY